MDRYAIAGRTAEAWIETAGDTPLFVYDAGMVKAGSRGCVRRCRRGSTFIMRSRPIPFAPLIAAMAPLVDGLDIASSGEMALALAAKPGSAISFAGPGKRDDEITQPRSRRG